MADKKDRSLNVIINNQAEDKDEVIISIATVFKMFKRYFTLWLAAAIIAAFVAAAFSCFTATSSVSPVKAVVNFTYKGIEKGLDPAGRKFDIQTIKSPVVIEAALTELEMDLDRLDDIRSGIHIQGLIPDDTYDRIAVYSSVMEKAANGNLTAAQAMLDEDYNPTDYIISFNYSGTGLNRTMAANVLNAVLDAYRDYFYKQYGFNKSLGTSVPATNYMDYDYAEQIDVFANSLKTVKSYLRSLSNDDTTNFRSNVTGFTFNDLLESAKTIESIDLDRISSYITVNNITKDKDAAIAFYNYRIDSLTRTKEQLTERLEALTASIETYEKDSILIFGNGTDGTDTQYAQASDQYDSLFRQKTNVETELAETKQSIKYYETKRSALQNNKAGTPANVEKVEAQLEDLNNKVTNLVLLTEQTADEYYENVEFANAYNILVPASNSAKSKTSSIINHAKKNIIVIEALLIFIYFLVAFIAALRADFIKKDRKAVPAGNADDDDDEDDDNVYEELADEEKETPAKNEKNSRKQRKK